MLLCFHTKNEANIRPVCWCKLQNTRECIEAYWRTTTFLSAILISTMAEITTIASLYLLWQYQRHWRTQHCRLWVHNVIWM